jgi:hypothetical protein
MNGRCGGNGHAQHRKCPVPGSPARHLQPFHRPLPCRSPGSSGLGKWCGGVHQESPARCGTVPVFLTGRENCSARRRSSVPSTSICLDGGVSRERRLGDRGPVADRLVGGGGAGRNAEEHQLCAGPMEAVVHVEQHDRPGGCDHCYPGRLAVTTSVVVTALVVRSVLACLAVSAVRVARTWSPTRSLPRSCSRVACGFCVTAAVDVAESTGAARRVGRGNSRCRRRYRG